MGNKLDLIGKIFTKLTVIEKAGSNRFGNVFWLCTCLCGNKTKVLAQSLTKGHTKSCGCLQKQTAIKTHTKHGHSKNNNKTPELHAYNDMKSRCYNHKHKRYKDYGARGIIVCDQWLNSFECFLSDMGNRPSPQHSIDRIDNNGNYEPSNCRWATDQIQSRNKRSNIKIVYNGNTFIISDLAKYLEIDKSVFIKYYKRGLSPDEIVAIYHLNKTKMK